MSPLKQHLSLWFSPFDLVHHWSTVGRSISYYLRDRASGLWNKNGRLLGKTCWRATKKWQTGTIKIECQHHFWWKILCITGIIPLVMPAVKSLLHRWKGPFKVEKFSTPVTVRLTDPSIGNFVTRAHLSVLNPGPRRQQ